MARVGRQTTGPARASWLFAEVDRLTHASQRCGAAGYREEQPAVVEADSHRAMDATRVLVHWALG
jgi:hypothetical protein